MRSECRAFCRPGRALRVRVCPCPRVLWGAQVYERFLTYRARLEQGSDKSLWRRGRGGHPCPAAGTTAADLSASFAGFLQRELPSPGAGGPTGRVYEVRNSGEGDDDDVEHYTARISLAQ